MAAVGQLVDQRRIAVISEDDGLIPGEECVVFLVRQTVRVLGVGLEFHEVDHVHHADLELRQLAAQDRYGGERFKRRRVTAAGHHDVRLLPLVVRRPFPDADALRAVLHGLFHREPLRARVLARHDDIYIVAALDAVVEAGEQAVGVGRQIHAHHIGLLVRHVVEKARVLMREAVVILLPDIRGEDIVERCNILPPRQLIAHLEPLGMLGEH